MARIKLASKWRVVLLLACCLVTLAGHASLQAQDVQVLFFTMEHCPPCRQMEPVVDRLGRDGYSIRKVDAAREQALAQSFDVRQTPTTIIVNGQTPVARQSGFVDYQSIKSKLDELLQSDQVSGSQRPNGAEFNGSGANRRGSDSRGSDSRRFAAEQSGSNSSNQPSSHAGSAQLSSVELASLQATVRLRVQDSKGIGFATGTVIHRHGEHALVLTCGHVFRASKGKGDVQVELGFGENDRKTVVGTVLAYDADKHDVALVSCQPGIEIEPVKFSLNSSGFNVGQPVYSIGCDAGADPTVRRSSIKKLAIYSGVDKFDVHGRPVLGRSGGGLFTADGTLVGVCNAAVVDIDEGIYAALPSIRWQIQNSNLAHVFDSRDYQRDDLNGQNRIMLAERDSRPAGQSLPSGNSEARRVMADNRVVSNQTGSQTIEGRELILVIRDPQNPTSSETITINQPSDELMKMIRVASTDNARNRIRQIPNLNPESLNRSSDLRAQSPK